MMTARRALSVGAALLSFGGCAKDQPPPADVELPADAAGATERLNASSRHGEWARIGTTPGDSIRAWVVYPERSDKAPVVIVVHEIYGLTPWVRAVADQLAAEGFIAIAPDLLTARNLPGAPEDGPSADEATAAIRTLTSEEVQRDLDATARYGMALPAAMPMYGIVGFCWGGTTAFEHALLAEQVGAAVVYYGSTPNAADFRVSRAPVLGLYGGDDNRVNVTIPAADSGMRAAGRSFASRVFPRAGHGFLRAQKDSVRGAANLEASRAAWPATVAFLREHLGT